MVNQKGFPNTAAYTVSKGGLKSLVRVLAKELAHRNIRTVAVSPGPIETPLFGKLGLSEDALSEFGSGLTEAVPLGRLGDAAEVAQTVLFLASEDASFINGAEIAVDGGLSQV